MSPFYKLPKGFFSFAHNLEKYYCFISFDYSII